MNWHTTTQNLEDEPTLAIGPLVPEQRWLAYHCTKLSRWTYFGWWIPSVPEQRWLAYHCTKLSRWTYFGWRIPSVPEQRCLEYQYTKLGKQTYSSQWTTSVPEWRWLANHYTKLGRWIYFHWWNPPGYQSRDDLQTTTQNFADEPTLANGSPSTKAEMTSIPVQQTRQTNIL